MKLHVISAADCQSCLKGAAEQLPKLCGKEADARIWFDYCFLRYDTKPFAGKLDTGYGLFYVNVENVTEDKAEQRRFDRELGSLMRKILQQAPAKGSSGLAKMKSKFTPFVTIYALAQCTQDLPPLACAQCVSISVANFPVLCPHRKGCRALYSSCYVRYEIYPFFFPIAAGSSTVEGSSVSVVIPP